MHTRIIKAVRPYLVRNGRPTAIVRKLQQTPEGKLLVFAMFNYYCSHGEAPNYSSWRLRTNIDIEKYRWCPFQMALKRLREAGL